MKKIAILLTIVATLCAGITTQAEEYNKSNNNELLEKILLYLPNRIVDVFDIFTLQVGFGPTLKAEVRATRAFQFGAGIGATAKAIKGYHRQYGVCLEDGWDATFACFAAENTEITEASRLVQEYWVHDLGIVSPSKKIYDFYKGSRDYWEIGVEGGAGLIEFDAGIHILEMVDMITGWFLIDFSADDFVWDDI